MSVRSDMAIVDRLRAAEGSDFPATAGPRSGRRIARWAAVTALRVVWERAGSFLPRLGAGRDLLQPRPLHFGDSDPHLWHLRDPP